MTLTTIGFGNNGYFNFAAPGDEMIMNGPMVGSGTPDRLVIPGASIYGDDWVNETTSTIESTFLGGVYLAGDRNNFTISLRGAVMGFEPFASETLSLRGTDNTVTNAGLLSASLSGGTALTLGDGGKIVNSGMILGAVTFTGHLDVTNTGNITGNIIAAPYTDGAHSIALTNSGTISSYGDPSSIFFYPDIAFAANYALYLGSGADSVTNTGVITGDIELGGGVDTFDGRGGTVVGTVFGGTGGDSYWIDDASARLSEANGDGIDTVNADASWVLGGGFEDLNLLGTAGHSGTGNDLANRITGNDAGNRLAGLGGDDWMVGGAGADTMDGGDGVDTAVYAESDAGVRVVLKNGRGFGGDAEQDRLTGIENLSGSAYADKLSGDGAANLLEGQAGNDRLWGGGNADDLVGGLGADRLVGGDGADHFVYRDAAESTIDKAGRDFILDFNAEQGDKIDLLAFLAEATVAEGTVFTGAGAEILVQKTAKFTAIVADLDGDMVADFSLLLRGSFDLTSDDFIL
jgi:hypothetical protein